MTNRENTGTVFGLLFLLLISVASIDCAKGSAQKDQKLKKGVSEQFPNPVGYINDFAHLLTKDEIDRLERLSLSLENNTTAQLAVVTINSISPYDSVEKYSLDLFNTWGIGQKDKNNGVLILVVVKEHLVRIEVGRGLESVITNEKCKDILQQKVTPMLRSGEFYTAIKNGMQEIMSLIGNR
jgi:uncharacterized protein